jgi:nucleoside-diphosphate-sugar epimerase
LPIRARHCQLVEAAVCFPDLVKMMVEADESLQGHATAVSSLVTGAGGFVGQWLVRALLASGEKVTGFTYGPPSESGILTREQRDAADWIEGDIRDQSSIQSAIDSSVPDAIYHLADHSFRRRERSDRYV